MNRRVEAQWILLRELVRWKRLPHSELIGLIDEQRVREQRGASGTVWQLETQFFWDDKPGGVIRVITNIDDGGMRAFCPMSSSALVAPGG